MRTFIAIELPPEIREGLYRLMEELQREGIQGRWVPPENLHLTLRFLGNIEEDRIEGIIGTMKGAAETASAFPISLKGLGAFPSLSRPRVLWVGVEKGRKELSHLQRNLEKRLISQGLPPEDKSFKPHLTLARFKFPKEEIKRKVLQACQRRKGLVWGETIATHLTLFESILSPQGAKYKKIHQTPLTHEG